MLFLGKWPKNVVKTIIMQTEFYATLKYIPLTNFPEIFIEIEGYVF